MSLGTRLYTWMKGAYVGSDAFGNRYYKEKSPPNHRRERRWVIYNGQAEASRVPPEWHAWLHYTSDKPLTERPAQKWQKEHLPNLTGTPAAYLPSGHDLRGGQREHADGDYEAWGP